MRPSSRETVAGCTTLQHRCTVTLTALFEFGSNVRDSSTAVKFGKLCLDGFCPTPVNYLLPPIMRLREGTGQRQSDESGGGGGGEVNAVLKVCKTASDQKIATRCQYDGLASAPL